VFHLSNLPRCEIQAKDIEEMPNLNLNTETRNKNWRGKMNVLTTIGVIIAVLMALSVDVCDGREKSLEGSSQHRSNDKKLFVPELRNSLEDIIDYTFKFNHDELKKQRKYRSIPTTSNYINDQKVSSTLVTPNITRARPSRLQVPLSPNKQQDRSKGCFNTTIIINKVSQSQIIFAGKVINITETVIHRTIPVASSQGGASQNPSSNGYFYYDFNRKRRRESRLGSSGQGGSGNSKVINVTLAEAIVHVKTVFKGPANMEGTLVMLTVEPGGDGSKESRSLSRCLRKLRTLDTRVFFYKTGTSGKEGSSSKNNGYEMLLTLTNQSFVPLPPTLHVLAAVRSAVKGNSILSLLLLYYISLYHRTPIFIGTHACHETLLIAQSVIISHKFTFRV